MSDYYNNFVVNTLLPEKLVKQNDLLDNAQYLMLAILEHLKLDIMGGLNLNKTLVNKHKNLLYEGLGIMVGSYNGLFGDTQFYLSGIPLIFNPNGLQINTSKQIKQYIECDKISELCFEQKAYIKPINLKNPDKYYGVFNSLKDAIKIVKENDFVKIGEVTS